MRTAFVVDGFNLYHSLVAASKSLNQPEERGTKWLDLWGLCSSYLANLGGGSTTSGVYYFSALATHLEHSKPGVVARHKSYISALKASGVEVAMGSFKKKPTKCRHCGKNMKLREEKETDVAIGVHLLELLHTRQADQVVLVTGDTDVAPAIRAAKRLFPQNRVCFAFPFNRKNDALTVLIDRPCIQITREAYVRHQFPDPLTIGQRSFKKPASW